MIENIKMEDLVETVPTSETAQVETEVTAETVPTEQTEQDLLTTELEKVQKREGRTELEKAEFSLKKTAERVKSLGGDYHSLLGVEQTLNDEDETPLTVGMLKKMQQETAAKTALQQADEIGNETERELVKYHLQNTIKSTGTPSEDLKLARALVNAVKNTQIIQEVNRKTDSKTHSSASSADALKTETLVLTPEEIQFKNFAGLTDEDILKTRAQRALKK